MSPVPEYIDVKIAEVSPYDKLDPRSAYSFFQFTYQVVDKRTNTVATDYFPMYHDYNGVDENKYVGEIHLFRSTGSNTPPSEPDNFYIGKVHTRRVVGQNNYLVHVYRYEDGTSNTTTDDPRRP